MRFVTTDLHETRQRLERLEAEQHAPIAIVGMSCRFPGGVRSPEELWDLVAAGGDAIADFPEDRGWDLDTLFDTDPDRSGTSYTAAGGFIYDAGEFDAGFFGISPREALAMDPQQRLILESSWEAIERAGIDVSTLRNTSTGVYVGASAQNYGTFSDEAGGGSEGYFLTGNAASVVSGRLAYVFGLEGPAVTVDTACSSSLVALHLAAQALRSGECGLALAGGVSVMSTPGAFVEFSRQRGLAADGRCKPFAAGADGTGWGEGVGLLLLERLPDAEANGHRVLAVLRGSAVNQDGASNGLTAPNGPSQQRVIRQALANAGLSARDVDVVEAHGTGTTLGDPIEAQALLATYGQDRPEERPLWLGSVKSNIGHTQSAAGVAGVIKMVMAMRHGHLPVSLHVDEPSPHVDWSAGEVRLLTEPVPWVGEGRVRRAGVSSFGVSGTNAHVILEEPPSAQVEAPLTVNEGPVAWVVSGRGDAGLRGQAAQLAEFVRAREGVDVAGVAAGLAGRAALQDRAVVVGGDVEELLAGLDVLAAGGSADGVMSGSPVGGKTGVLFTGQGSQFAGMGAQLYERFGVFAGVVDEVCAVADGLLPEPLRPVIFGEDGRGELVGETVFAQVGLLALEVGLWRVLVESGVRADVLVGHSVGEISAAVAAGVLSLEDAVRLACARGGLMQKLAGGGVMASVAAPAGEVRARVEGVAGVWVAAVNAPESVVLAGEPDAVRGVVDELTDEGVRCRWLPVGHAFHTPLMDPVLEDFATALGDLSVAPAQIPVVSTVSGEVAGVEFGSAAYWVEHARRPVQFADAVEVARELGVRVWAEVGPQPALSAAMPERDCEVITAFMRRDRDQVTGVLTGLARLHVHGVEVGWEKLVPSVRPVEVPTYAFQRRRYWAAGSLGSSAGSLSGAGLTVAGHRLLGAQVSLAGGGVVLTGRLSVSAQPWLADHAVSGVVVLPGTAFVDLAVHAGGQVGCPRVEELTLQAPLVLVEGGPGVAVQVVVDEPEASGDHGRRAVSVFSRADMNDDGEWVRHGSGFLTTSDGPADSADTAWVWPPAGDQVPAEGVYAGLADAGFDYGPVFRGLRKVWLDGKDVYAEVELPDDPAGFALHPALLDAALHALAATKTTAKAEGGMPFAFSGVQVHTTGARTLHVRLRRNEDGVGVEAVDPTGQPVVTVESLAFRPINRASLAGSPSSSARLLQMRWAPVPEQPADSANESATESAREWVLVGNGAGDHADLAGLAEAMGDGAASPTLVVLSCPGTPGEFGEESGGAARAEAMLVRLLAEVQAFLASSHLTDSRLLVLTRGAVTTEEPLSPVDPAMSAIWGMIRSAQTENPDRFILLDLDPQDVSVDDDALMARMLPAVLASGLDQIALRGGELIAPALGGIDDDEKDRLRLPEQGPWRLMAGSGGTLTELTTVSYPEAGAPLLPGTVRLSMRATGLNFRDVLIALGMYPGDATLGSEGAGVVTEVGPDVTGLAVGDRVMGLIPDAFGDVVVANARTVAPIPAAWSFAEAASVPVAFLTAYYSLVRLADLRPGERVLIHAGAGGVGMAAVQLARHLGADVFATAHPSKWETLRGLGLPDSRIASSRDLDFRTAFLGATDGAGVDVVLNSLAGEFVDASLELLPRGGRFIEMGKTDLRDAADLPADVQYRTFDLSEPEPVQIGDMLAELLALFADSRLALLPTTVWDVRRAPAAFRYLSQARHVGKNVLTLPVPFDRDGTVLVTGGTGVLGGLVAEWLVSVCGVRRLVLVGRGGLVGSVVGCVERLEGLGAVVRVVAADVSSRGGVVEALGTVEVGFPLVGVVHAAGVVDDGVVGSLSGGQVGVVMGGKAGGAWWLHELTRGVELSFFLVFSSLAGVVGSAGQANYAAANGFVDGLVQWRRSCGLVGQSVAWGLWDVVGGMAGGLSEGDVARMSRGGVTGLSASEGLELLGTAMEMPDALTMAARWDWRAWENAPVVPQVLRELVRDRSPRPRRGQAPANAGIRSRLTGLSRNQAVAAVSDVIRGEVAGVLGFGSVRDVSVGLAFREMGFDSLTAVELRNRLGVLLGVRLSATVVFDHPSVVVLAEYVCGLLGVGGSAGAADGGSVGVVGSVSGSVVGVGDPVVVVGVGCRYPGGVVSGSGLWDLVVSGGDAVGGFPVDRGWDVGVLEGVGDVVPGGGGFVHGAALFDAGFFGISPREALAMDPQQRLLLEVAWEALEDAGVDAVGLRGSRTGVFAGVIPQDYAARLSVVPDEVAGYVGIGNTTSVVSGRVAYAFGFEGPAVTVDTACSSSLVSLHLAAQALRSGECDVALAGGVTVMSTPATFVEFARQRGLAADGRCKAFAAGADGTGWGEGAGLLVLERLSDAVAKGHRVLAVVRGSAVNQDGASNGLTAPNGPSQQRVIRQALANAGLSVGDVDVVEAHGTGTTLGDPIEAQALLATYGQGRSQERPLWLGSVKSNIGHTQAAAGVAGVIKMVMAMRHGRLPETLHVDEPSPHVDWSAGEVRLLTEPVEWQRDGRPRRAAVSSFGVSGTNAHVILEEPPALEEAPVVEAEPAGVVPWVLSGRGDAGLRAQAAQLSSHLRGLLATDAVDAPSLTGVALGLAGRAALEDRAVVTGGDFETLLAGLDAVAAGESSGDVVSGVEADGSTGVVFVFPGQGGQWVGMGAELLDRSSVFAESVAECERGLGPFVDWSLREVLAGSEREWLGRVDVVQPVLWAVMVSLARVWRAAGVVPDAVVGHSQGEIAAAVVAGRLSVEDGARVVALRSAALRELAGRGAMASVALDPQEAEKYLPSSVSVAAVNAPGQIVVSGPPDQVAALCARLDAEGVRARRIEVDYASHHAQVEAVEERLRSELAGVVDLGGSGPKLVSTVTGLEAEPGELEAAYWYRNLREPVLFADVIRRLQDAGPQVFIEIGPHPVLSLALEQTVTDGRVLHTLRRDQPDEAQMLRSLGEAWVAGLPVAWGELLPAAEPVALPTYAFQRHRYWLEAPVSAPGIAAPVGASVSDGWRYRVGWTPLAVQHAGGLPRQWLLLCHAGGEVADVRRALEQAGAEVEVRVLPADPDRTDVADLLTGAGHIAYLPAGFDRGSADEGKADGEGEVGLSEGLTAVVAVMQAVAGQTDTRLWILSRGAVTTPGTDTAPDPALAAVWGLGRVFGLEHPDHYGGLIDLPAVWQSATGGQLTAALAEPIEDQTAIGAAGVFVRRLQHAPARSGADQQWKPSGTVVITGGTGGLGSHLARWLARNGAEQLILVSRSGPGAPGASELADELTAQGTPTTVVACDITDSQQVAQLLGGTGTGHPPITTVIHAAATIELAWLRDATPEHLSTVLDAKCAGAVHLADLLGANHPDVRLVLFSSIAGIWGSGMHSAYAAANAYLDALAESRAASQLITSVAWGIWDTELSLGRVDPDQMYRQGLPFLDRDLALDALAQVLGDRETVLAVAEVDWPTFVPVFTAARPRPLLSELPEVRALESVDQDPADRAESSSVLVDRLASATEAERDTALLDTVRTEVAAVLGHADVAAVAPTRAFRDIGFDSLTAVDLRNRLGSALGLRLPATVVFDYPTPRALAAFLKAEVWGSRPTATATQVVAFSGEPIAIVGMSCRFPGGVHSAEALWDLLAEQGDAVAGFPADRGWDMASLHHPDRDRPNSVYAQGGGFLHDAALFDPAFFGISPREARAMDPQQRLLLEAAWEAFERAGIDPESLAGSPTGVFVGSNYQDYGANLTAAPEGSEGHLLTGGASSVLSGRIAYTFGLEGPAVTVDTACSSSLVGVHLASQALRLGECSMALAGGVAVMGSPNALVAFSKQGALSPDGRCRSFSASAEGMGMAEGVGLVLLERLSDAVAKGHRVLAVVRGSAVNQDGASNGLTAPNGPSQQRVIRQALANARMDAGDVDVVEAHGTGTTLGDPIEAQALLATYGQGRPEGRPLWLGSVKSNIGHTQAASGVAGVIKMVMAMQHRLLPATLHADTPSPHVDWSGGGVRLLTEPVPWVGEGRVRRAGVSSFGVSGTNAHVILEEPPALEEAPVVEAEPAGVVPWVLSGRGDAGLRAQAAQLANFVRRREGVDVAGVAAGLAGRAGLEDRAVVVGSDVGELLAGLDVLAAGGRSASGAVGGAGVVFVFPGQGGQWVGMGAELLDRSSVFAESVAECERGLAPFVDWSLREVLSGSEREWLGRVDVVQPVLWAVMVSLARVWRAAGVVPDAVVGHSQGEIAAAVVAGRLSVEDGARIVALRSAALRELAGSGAMASVALDPQEAEKYLSSSVSVAAVNAPGQIVVSGPPDEVAELCARLEEEGVRARRIEVDYASHHAQVEAVEERLRSELAGVVDLGGQGPKLVSTVTGLEAEPGELGAGYWYRNLREPVMFAGVIRRLQDAGPQVFIEIGPHPVLGLALSTVLADTDGRVLHTLRRDQPDEAQMLRSLGEAWSAGLPVAWGELLPAAEPVALPTYAFQRQRYWLDAPAPLPGIAAPVGASVSDGWRYRVGWTPLAVRHADRLSRQWLLLCHDGGEVAYVRRALELAGAEVEVRVLPADPDRTDVADLLTGAGHIAYLPAGFDRSHPDHPGLPGGLAAVLAVMRAVAEQPDTQLWVLTRGAVTVPGSDTASDPTLAAVWGLGRVFGLEHPDHYGGLIDLPAVWQSATGGQLTAALAEPIEDQIALRNVGVFARRLQHAPAAPGDDQEWKPSGTVLITGGTGALGSHLARWLARNGAAHLVLVSRTGPAAPGATELADELTAQGTPTTVVACDIADSHQVAELFDGGGTGHPPINTVIHAAGVPQRTTLRESEPGAFAELLRAKVTGTRNLVAALDDHPVDNLVLFSSNSGVWGSGMHSAYAAANAYLDAVAEQLRAQGVRATSIAWGLWGGGGMAEGDGEQYLSRVGIRPMAPDLAVAALHEALTLDETFVAVADVDWEQFVPTFTVARRRPLIEDLPEVRRLAEVGEASTSEVAGDEARSLRSRLAGLAADDQYAELLGIVRREAARILELPGPEAVEEHRAFRELGFDSVTAVEVRNRLRSLSGLQLPATLVFDHPTPGAVVTYLRGALFPDGSDAGASPLDQIERLEKSLLRMEPDNREKARITLRLQSLLEKWSGGNEQGHVAADAQFESATPDEVFDFIDKELGQR
ncbi:SDR family NAD(P)-dependent oxidoreductase [Streptomyces sp. NBC_00838]|uniref:SDR family NAD(P)-dependent oxidoreductase n=1 Tax=Streptomyces sp. NBC_00838 TaxID=2903680 RepID=UPI0038690802